MCESGPINHKIWMNFLALFLDSWHFFMSPHLYASTSQILAWFHLLPPAAVHVSIIFFSRLLVVFWIAYTPRTFIHKTNESSGISTLSAFNPLLLIRALNKLLNMWQYMQCDPLRLSSSVRQAVSRSKDCWDLVLCDETILSWGLPWPVHLEPWDFLSSYVSKKVLEGHCPFYEGPLSPNSLPRGRYYI